MSTPRLTASRLELAATCPGSQAHEHVESTNAAAERGTAIHDYIAALLQDEEREPPLDQGAASACRGLHRQRLVDAAQPNPYSALYTELALYLRPDSGEAGMLEGSYHRDYSGAPEGSIPGTADVVAVEEDRVRVTDWKTGEGEIPDPAENHQLRFLGLAAARAFGREEAVIQLGLIGAEGSVELRPYTLEADELAATEMELARIAHRVGQARSGEPVYKEGRHCRRCPALPRCPAIAGAAQAILDGPPEELTDRRAAELWHRLQAVEAAAKKTRQALQEYVYAREVPTAEGRVLKMIETRRQNIHSPRAFKILREYLPDDALAEAVTVTKSSLSGALSQEAQRQILAEFQEAGAVTDTYSESLREVRSRGA